MVFPWVESVEGRERRGGGRGRRGGEEGEEGWREGVEDWRGGRGNNMTAHSL